MYISVYIYSTVSIYDIKLYHSYRAVGSSPGVGRLIDQSGDTAEGIEIEARSAEKIIRLHFQLSGWALVALSYFED